MHVMDQMRPELQPSDTLAASIGRRTPISCCVEGRRAAAFHGVSVGLHRVLSTQIRDLDTAYACVGIDF